ncbi:hypothetical protein DM02DRAFT_632457 [Periconia macrospinosa]|uniref:Uncharacterized protein n=1 Tax=Periconia macrospinosa TaxID=97972 RepID=A0A2V1DCP5_9PLEO|nr:hypothetical protein DM02DRAFT_632457 [Periconia macrospinosa]
MSNTPATTPPYFEELFGPRKSSSYWRLEDVVIKPTEPWQKPKKIENDAIWGSNGKVKWALKIRCHLCFDHVQKSDPLMKREQSLSGFSPYIFTEKEACPTCSHQMWLCAHCKVVAYKANATLYAFDGIDRLRTAPGFRISPLYGDIGNTFENIYGDGEEPNLNRVLDINLGPRRTKNTKIYVFAYCCRCNLAKEEFSSWLFYSTKATQREKTKCASDSCQQASQNGDKHNPWKCPDCIRVLGFTNQTHFDKIRASTIEILWVFPDSFMTGRRELLRNPVFLSSAKLNPQWKLIPSDIASAASEGPEPANPIAFYGYSSYFLDPHPAHSYYGPITDSSNVPSSEYTVSEGKRPRRTSPGDNYSVPAFAPQPGSGAYITGPAQDAGASGAVGDNSAGQQSPTTEYRSFGEIKRKMDTVFKGL